MREVIMSVLSVSEGGYNDELVCIDDEISI